MDQDGPDVDKHEEDDIGKFLQREDEREDMIWNGLGEAIDWVKGVRGVRGWHDPLVMRFVEVLVDQGVVQASMYPVDAKVGEADEEWKLQNVVPQSRTFSCDVVHFTVSANLGQEEWGREDRHEG
jgi:hypothetical protein